MRVILCIVVLVAVASAFPGTCPFSSKAKIGCFCTNGCSLDGDTTFFPWTPTVFPPARMAGETLGGNTICAKITTVVDPNSETLVEMNKALGVSGQINTKTKVTVPPMTEVTTHTAFTYEECLEFMKLAMPVVFANPHTHKLRINLCTTENCNGLNDEEIPKVAPPGEAAQRFPGGCPTSNPNPTGCFCTNNCSLNGDRTVFLWSKNAWPPVYKTAKFVGSDTICARITVPVMNTAAGRVMSQFLGISGNVAADTTKLAGPPFNTQVTVYTAFTQGECANFQLAAQALVRAHPDADRPLIFFCTGDGCNDVGTVKNGAGAVVVSVLATLLLITMML